MVQSDRAHQPISPDAELEGAPSVLVLPLTETPLRPIVHLAPMAGEVEIDEVIDLPDMLGPGWLNPLRRWVTRWGQRRPRRP